MFESFDDHWEGIRTAFENARRNGYCCVAVYKKKVRVAVPPNTHFESWAHSHRGVYRANMGTWVFQMSLKQDVLDYCCTLFSVVDVHTTSHTGGTKYGA